MSIARVVMAALIAAGTSLGGGATEPIEGRWQITGHGAIIDIVPAPGPPGHLDVIAVDCPDMSIAPGTLLGSMTATGVAGTYDCYMSTDPRGDSRSRLRGSRSMSVSINDDDRLVFKFYHRGVRVSLRRWLPYLFRVSVTEQSNRPDGLDGAVRVDGASPTFITI